MPGGSGNAGIGSHLDGATATDGAAGQAAGPGGSGIAGKGSHLDGATASDGAAGRAAGPGGSGIAGIGSHLDGATASDGAAGQAAVPGGSGNAGKGSHLDEAAGTGRGSRPRAGKAGQFPANHYLCGMIATLLSILLCCHAPSPVPHPHWEAVSPQPRPTIVLHPHEEVTCRCGKSSPHEEAACRCGKSSAHKETACHKEAARPDGKRFPEDVNVQEAAHPEQATPDGKACLEGYRKVFLAGTIDGGESVDWQAEAEKFFISRGGWAVFNPRQKEWHPERPGEMDYQVNWELSHLEQADAILMYFADGSKSPITLLELGLHARSGKLRVVCTEKFYRYDNVRITCERYGIPVFTTLQEALKNICEP